MFFMYIFFWYGLKMYLMVVLFICNYMKLELNSFEDYFKLLDLYYWVKLVVCKVILIIYGLGFVLFN